MNYILNRASLPELYDARAQRYRILKTARAKRCGTCTFEVPEGDVVMEDGAERCPMCKDTLTAEWKANEEREVAAVKAAAYRALFQPPQFSVRPLQEARPGVVSSITDGSGVTVYQSAPLAMVHATPVTLLLIGQRFAATDTLSYSSGITDDVPPVITSTLITLSLAAFVVQDQATPGRYNVTYNSHVYRGILLVR